MEDQVEKKSPLSLNLLSQIQVIKIVHKKAARMESDYMDKWMTR